MDIKSEKSSRAIKGVINNSLKQSPGVENFILEEFKYASTYTQQMLKDRTNAINMYITFFAVSAAILGFLFKNDLQKFEELINTISPYLPYLLLLFGIIHTFFFTRIGYLEKRYNSYLLRMNCIREFYIKYGRKEFPDIETVLTPIIMPRTRGIVYPLFPATFAYAIIATILFGSIPFSFSGNWIISTFLAVIIVLISCLIFYFIAKKSATV